MAIMYIVVRTKTSSNTRPVLYTPPASKSGVSARQVINDNEKSSYSNTHPNAAGELLFFVAGIDRSANGTVKIIRRPRKHLENAQRDLRKFVLHEVGGWMAKGNVGLSFTAAELDTAVIGDMGHSPVRIYYEIREVEVEDL